MIKNILNTCVLLVLILNVTILKADEGSQAIVTTIDTWGQIEKQYKSIRDTKEDMEKKLEETKKVVDATWFAQNAVFVYDVINLLNDLGCLLERLRNLQLLRAKTFRTTSCYYDLRMNVTTLNIRSNLTLVNSTINSFSNEVNSLDKSSALNNAVASISKTVSSTQKEIVAIESDLAIHDASMHQNNIMMNNYLMEFAAATGTSVNIKGNKK